MNRGGAWPFRPELLVLTLFGLGSFGFPGLGGGGGGGSINPKVLMRLT